MSYRVHVRRAIQRRIVAWGLPDTVFVEVLLRLQETLARNPPQQLVRVRLPFDGMVYHFSLVDPTNRFREYSFAFHVLYSQDEESLLVVNCAYQAHAL